MSKEEKENKKGKKGCTSVFLAIILIFFVIILIVLAIVVSHPDDFKKSSSIASEEPVKIIFDATKYAGMSPKQVKAELGEPERKDTWNYEQSNGTYKMTDYDYYITADDDAKTKLYLTFEFYNKKLARIQLFADDNGKISYTGDTYNIFKMFGIEKTNDDISWLTWVDGVQPSMRDMTQKVINVSDDIPCVYIYNLDYDSHTFDTVYFTYDRTPFPDDF
ncbi:MAG: hypothetical protein SPL99_07420 [Catonella sp.]|nr:hypothetical protein [Catonella sp.]MDY6356863.1 hypothetical protein [Catonella sp.]